MDILEASQGTMKYLGLFLTQEMLEKIRNFEQFAPIAATLYCFLCERFTECPRNSNHKVIFLTGILPKECFNDYLVQSHDLHNVTLDFSSKNLSIQQRTFPLAKLKSLTLCSMSVLALDLTSAS